MSFSEIEHIIWDWNGTILDDALLCEELTNRQLEQLGLKSLSSETHQMLFQHPVQEYYRRLGAQLTNAQFKALAEDFHAEYGRRRAEAGVRAGVKNFIREATIRGLTHSVLSAYKEEDLISLIHECGMSELFMAIVGLPNCQADSKVERGAQWMRESGLQAEKVLLIGDTDHDFHAAEKMGVQCVLIPSGYQHWNILNQCSCPIFDSFTEFSEAVLAKTV